MRRARGAGSQTIDATQLALFEPPASPHSRPQLTSPDALSADSTLDSARWWYKVYLESQDHPPNTVAAYTNDLSILQAQVGTRPIRLIDAEDIGAYLDSAKKKSTRKRRLTSVREFYDFLINAKKVVTYDPTEPFFPERIHLKTPIPLFEGERAQLLATALEDSPRSYLMVYCMLELGINRTELLNLRKGHIDNTVQDRPVVYVQYDNPRWRHKERRLQADERFAAAFTEYEPNMADERLFPMLPQVVNSVLHRLVRTAGLDRQVTPQSLRDTFGVEQARRGRSEDELLAVLGLADDPRNRDSVRRYLKLAEPPSEVLSAETKPGA